MKKTYFNPTLKVTQVEVCNMVCQSLHGLLNTDTSEKITQSSDFGAKERDEDYESDGWSDGLW